MHIGIDGRFWFETGVGRYTRNLVRQLQEIDTTNTYTIFTRGRNYPHIKPQLVNKNWDVVKTNIKWHTIAEQTKFPKVLEEAKVDLMHFPYFSVPIYYKGPFIVTIHDLILHHFSTGEATTLPLPLYKLKLAAYKYVIKKAAQNAQRIITVSEATKKEIVDHLEVPKSKVVVTYEGIDPDITRGASGVKLMKEPYILHVGNLYPHKNMNQFLKAFKESKKKLKKDLKLVIVGREDYFYNRFKKVVEQEKMKDSVVFPASVNDQELISIYRNAIGVAVPSLMEGFGLPAVEAMANKSLVMASDIPSLREICGDAAVYFNPKSIRDMAETIVSVASGSAKYTSKVAIGERRAKEFSWKKMAKDTLAVYESSTRL